MNYNFVLATALKCITENLNAIIITSENNDSQQSIAVYGTKISLLIDVKSLPPK